jgi:uncharacterized protein (UPF0335 family)
MAKKNVVKLRTEADEKIAMENKGYGISGEHLKQLVERIERLQEEQITLNEDIKEVFAEAKGTGFDIKIIKIILKERKQDKDVLLEQEYLLEIYRAALGMTPLEEYAAQRAAEDKVEINGIECNFQQLMKATKITDEIVQQVKAMHNLGGFRANTENEKELAEKLVDFGLLKQPNKFDNLYMLTAKAEKLAAK